MQKFEIFIEDKDKQIQYLLKENQQLNQAINNKELEIHRVNQALVDEKQKYEHLYKEYDTLQDNLQQIVKNEDEKRVTFGLKEDQSIENLRMQLQGQYDSLRDENQYHIIVLQDQVNSHKQSYDDLTLKLEAMKIEY